MNNKRRMPSTRETGDFIGNVAGFKGGIFGFLFTLALGLASISSLFVRFFLRKSQGKGVTTVLRLILALSVGSAIIVLYEGQFNTSLAVYLGGVLIALLYHFFVDLTNDNHDIGINNPHYEGVGFLASFKKGTYLNELIANLFDGLLGSSIGYFLFENYAIQALGLVVIWSSICLFLETLLLIYRDRQTIENAKWGEAMSKHYTSPRKGMTTSRGVKRISK